jgi:hypothetical protein
MPKATTEPPPMMTDLDPRTERTLYAFSTSAAALAPSPAGSVEHLLRYIEACPTGQHNREVAERIEEALLRMREAERSHYHARYRRARDPYMPTVERQPVSRLRRPKRMD